MCLVAAAMVTISSVFCSSLFSFSDSESPISILLALLETLFGYDRHSRMFHACVFCVQSPHCLVVTCDQ